MEFFDPATVKNIDERKRHLTIRHLLTMSAGLDWTENVSYDDPRNSEILMENHDDWAKFVINLPMAREPGTTFLYNSGATELLAHVFEKETGQDLGHYAEKHLFEPIGITSSYWRRTRSGMVDAVGGLFLKSEDLARIGYLFLHKGTWDGRQIVTAQWVQDSLSPALDAGDGWRYGYQWWLREGREPSERIFAARGWGMQRLVVNPRQNLVFVYTGWDIPVSQQETEIAVMQRIFAGVRPHSCDPESP